jgi:hypothetical protein
MPNKLPPLPVGAAPGSYFWNDWYEKLRTLINSLLDGISWSLITGTPTTLAGYGITDAQKGIQFQDEGGNLGASGTADTVNFTGAGVTASRASNTITVNISGGAGSSWTETEIDFGASPVWDKSFTIVDGTVSGTNKIIVVPSANPPTGRYADDWQWDSICLAAVSGTGQFTLYTNADGPVEGKRNILYQVI